MPNFFFSTRERPISADTEATELPDLSAARKHAIVFAGDVMHSEPEVLWDGREFQVDVKNGDGLLLFTLTAFVTNAPAAGDTK